MSLPFNLNFYGTTLINSIYINNNGNVTFDMPNSVYNPTVMGLITNRIIAPFWADVDTRGDTNIGSATVNQVYYGNDSLNGTNAFAVTWNLVGYYSNDPNGGHDKLNSFQVVLINRSGAPGRYSGDFDIEFNYNWIQWDTGDDSGGVHGVANPAENPTNIFPAIAGYSDGTVYGGSRTGPGIIIFCPGPGLRGPF